VLVLPFPSMADPQAQLQSSNSGIDLAAIDSTVRAQDDFFKHVNGQWQQTTEIPADKSEVGSFTVLDDEEQDQLRWLVEAAARAAANASDPNRRKIGDLYQGFMDKRKLEQLGLKPLSEEWARIDRMKSKSEIPKLIAHFNESGVTTPYDISVGQDAKDSTRYVVSVSQSGLSLPDRDYYFDHDTKLTKIRDQYLHHVQRMLKLAGVASATTDAQGILKLETAIAEAEWTKVENRDPVKTYNKIALAKLTELTPGYDWPSYLESSDLTGRISYVIVNQPSYLTAFSKILAVTPLRLWKAYFRWHVVHAFAPYLSKAFVDENFTFYGTALGGVPTIRPRWKRGVSLVDRAIGEGLGQLYVEQHFPPESKMHMLALVNNLLSTYRQSIDTLDWMSSTTKKEAQAKLSRLVTKIGYPNKWRDYSGLQIVREDLVGNVIRATEFQYHYDIGKLGKPIDREEWQMTPQTINAYYDPQLNEIVFPAAILQRPFFDPKADDAVNYGSIGAVIGHEISHGFDDVGSQFDADGNLRDWFTKEDHQTFAAKTAALVAQYTAYTPAPGFPINGKLTLGENIADISGLAIAYKAYRRSLHGREAPVIDGLTGNQRFYMGFARVWRAKIREKTLIVLIKSDPHSPPAFRVQGAVANQPGFYQAFGVRPGDKMYLPPDKRVTIW
jgi:putative endopeptidase